MRHFVFRKPNLTYVWLVGCLLFGGAAGQALVFQQVAEPSIEQETLGVLCGMLAGVMLFFVLLSQDKD